MIKTKAIDLQDWVTLYSDDLYRWAFHKTSNKETAQDLVQDTFLSAFKSLDKFKGNSQPKTWLFSIINNKITDYHRKKFRQSTTAESALNTENTARFFDEAGSWKTTHSPLSWHNIDDHLLDNNEFNIILKKCIENLPPNWAFAIQNKYIEDRDSKAICQDLGVTTSNYWQILHRAKLQLRDCLQHNWF